MTQSSATTVLPDKRVNIPLNLGKLVKNMLAGFFLYTLFVSCTLQILYVSETWPSEAALGVMFLGVLILLILILMPIGVARDVGNLIPEVKAARKKNKELNKIKIRHPYAGLIILLSIASFWTGLGWIIAMVWACSPGKVVIPDEVYTNVFTNTRP